MDLSVCYVTNRRDCRIEWAWDSLQLQGADKFKFIVVDYYHAERDTSQGIWKTISEQAKHVPPKPNVWNTEYRLPREPWFAASSQRNTGLCVCDTPGIAWLDDLSVTSPSWIGCVLEALAGNYIMCGAYSKSKHMLVEKGVIKTFEPYAKDNRLSHVIRDVTSCSGNFLYGCSVAGPTEAFLSVNGWGEMNDGLSGEDYCMGIVLKNAGWELKYDRRAMTMESEELHHAEKPFRREDWHFENGKPVLGGNGKDDKSHSALNIAIQSKRFENYFGEGGIRALRDSVLAGNPFPIQNIPQHCWYTGIPLKDL